MVQSWLTELLIEIIALTLLGGVLLFWFYRRSKRAASEETDQSTPRSD